MMNFNQKLILDIIETGDEHARLEFKADLDINKLCDYIVALANEGSGQLFVGVLDKKPRRVVGTQSFADLALLRRTLYDKLKLRVDIEEFMVEGKRLVIFDVPPRQRGTPLSHNGRFLMRLDDSLLPMTAEQMKKIFDEVNTDILLNPASNSIDGDEVIACLDTQTLFELLKQPYPREQSGVLERLIAEKLLIKSGRNYIVTKLGALLLGKDLSQFDAVKTKGVRVITYKGNNKLETIRDLQGNKGYASGFAGLIDYINSQLPANEHIEEALRKTVRVFPEIAIRELVANAIIHQDFSISGTRVTIEIYLDRIVIINPGKPMIDEKRFIDEFYSRNELLAAIMRRMGICEEQGSGIDKVISSIEAYQLPAPDFRVADIHTSIILFTPIPFNQMDSKDRVRAAYQHCCLKYVCNQKMSNQSLRQRLHMGNKQQDIASQIIRQTLEEGLVKVDDPENTSRRYVRYVPYWA